jgi:ethanolamine utilization protein EutA
MEFNMLLHEGHGHHHHVHDEDKQAVAQSIWQQETVELTTAGIDVGSSTSHLLFARIRLQRHRAGFQRSDIDSGAVILTGEAIKRKNSRKIADLFAEEAGKFVCATAGHKLECTLAAHGSGAVAMSKANKECILHIDIGGGTTKLALIDKGQIVGVCAFAVGGRLLAKDEDGKWTRVDESAQLVAEELGYATDPDTLEDIDVRRKIVHRLANIAVGFISGAVRDKLGMTLQLTEDLPRNMTPDALSFSGGVSEYLLHGETQDYGDIAIMLAEELHGQLPRMLKLPIRDPGQGIRATVIGASQFTVQVSGKTIYITDQSILPVHNVPVVHITMDLSGEINEKHVRHAIVQGMHRMDLAPQHRMAIAFNWEGDPEYKRLKSMGKGIINAVAPDGVREGELLLMIHGDIGNILGNLLTRELGLSCSLLSVDGVQLQELDYVDVGEMIDPPGVVPIVIKSLLFS